jgi:hypothetical protein
VSAPSPSGRAPLPSTHDLVAGLAEFEKLLLALLANGGWRYRELFRATDAEVDALCATAMARLRYVYVLARAGERLAAIWGREAELRVIAEDMLKAAAGELGRPPPPKPAVRSPGPNRRARRHPVR